MFDGEYFTDSRGQVYMPLRLLKGLPGCIEIVYIGKKTIKLDTISMAEHIRNMKSEYSRVLKQPESLE